LRPKLARLGKKGVYGLLSNADTGEMRELYEKHDLNVRTITVARAINSDPKKRGDVNELVVTTYGDDAPVPRTRAAPSSVMSEEDRHSHRLAPDEIIRAKVKAELRKRMRGVRKTTPLESCGERSRSIAARLSSLDVVVKARRVALFWPMVERHEVDLRAFDAELRARGVKIAYPAIDPDTNVMTFREVRDPADLIERGFGFSEPAADAPEATDLDLVVVPALAVDPTGHRIGYGAGYYDRTLPRYAPPAVAVAVVYDWQMVVEVPATETDVRVAFVVTDTRVFDAKDAS